MFERLTGANHKELGFHTYVGTKNPYSVALTLGELLLSDNITNLQYNPRKILDDVFDRLAAYEDSGLTPEEVQELKVSVKICEDCWNHAQAKADGRLVVLPVKVGDTVYRIISYKCNAVCNKLNACNSFIYKACKQAEFYVCPGTFQLNDMGWIGKTVFLTREAAEKALEVGE